MKGILLAGGSGTRLLPLTRVVSKHLLPVYDKPMVHYPLSTLMLCGVREILVITSPQDAPQYRALLGDGAELGLRISYAQQPTAGGIAQALIIGREFIGTNPFALVLGDNLFYGQGLSGFLQDAVRNHTGATIFGVTVKDPRPYGVAILDSKGKLVDVQEKPAKPKSMLAIPGLYFYDAIASEIAAKLKPSRRGEIEITDVNRAFLKKGKIRLAKFGRGAAWFDAGTPQALLDASNFIATLENRQGLKVACLEEVAYRMGFIDARQLRALAEATPNEELRNYLADVGRAP
jgi:glucose-1-phosphate thymidylyltransferase